MTGNRHGYQVRAKRGFTLMEVLVALALFSVVVTVSTNLFLSFQRTSRKTESLEQLTASARFIMEKIAREVREGTVDYQAYVAPLATPLNQNSTQDVLYLRNSADELISFVYAGNTITLNGEELTGASVRVRTAQFTVIPSDNPFQFNELSGTFAADAQPRVTIFISLDNNKPEDDRDYTKYDVQTTISSRVYRR